MLHPHYYEQVLNDAGSPQCLHWDFPQLGVPLGGLYIYYISIKDYNIWRSIWPLNSRQARLQDGLRQKIAQNAAEPRLGKVRSAPLLLLGF